MPYTQQPFQPPYPISSPPPQSQTPSGPRPTQGPQDYQAFPPHLATSNQRHSLPPDAYGQNPGQETGQPMYNAPSDISQPPRQSYPPVQAPHTSSHDQPDYASSPYPNDEGKFQSQPSSQGYGPPPEQNPGAGYPPPNAYQSPPAHAPPAVPPERQSTPLAQSSAYPVFKQNQPPSGYQPYQRTDSFPSAPSAPPNAAYAGGGNPANFYR